MKNLYNKTLLSTGKAILSSMALIFLSLANIYQSKAQVVITDPSLYLYPCSTYPTNYTTLGNIVITEGGNTDFQNSQTNVTLILTPSAGFEFQAGIGSVSRLAGGDMTAASISVVAGSITITFTTDGNPTAPDALTISGIKVRALSAAAGTGYIGRGGGTAVINGSVIGGLTYATLIATTFPVANAGSDQLICATNYTFGASAITDPNITGTWTLVSGTGTITSPNSPTSGVTGLSLADNIFKWTITNGFCTSSSNVTITAMASGLGCTVASNSFAAVTNIVPAVGTQNVTCPPSSTNITTFTLSGTAPSDPSKFNVGDKVLVIQMAGATVNTTDAAVNDGSKDAVFGAVTSYNGAGNYEYAIIATKSGNDVTFSQNLKNTYNVAGKVQLVTVPQFANYTLSTALTGTPWNSSSGTGGVLVFEVAGTLTLNGGTISMDYRGFLGGGNTAYPGAPLSGAALSFGVYDPGTGAVAGFGVYSTGVATPSTGFRGEGIALSASHLYGRGALANGGGSGAGWNSGAGGGSNICAGGRGGYEFSSRYTTCGVNPLFTGCVPNYAAGNGTASGQPARMHGIGGYALTAGASQVFMGGGGGAGNGDNAKATAGGNGGGIIIITAGTIAGTSGTISANGQGGYYNTGSTGDATGAGGAGGSIILDVTTYSIGALKVTANGGKGGNQDQPNTCHGNGGGGGGGLIRTKGVTPNVTLSAVGGNYGTQRPSPNTDPDTEASLPLSNDNSCAGGTPYGATAGGSCTGSAQTLTQVIPQKSCCSPANLGPDQTICGTASITLSNGTASNTNKTFKWYKNGILIGGATSATYVATSAGTYSVVVDSIVAGFDYCSVTNSMIITNSFPVPFIGPNQTLCNPAYLDLSPSNVASFPGGTVWQWSLNGSNLTGETTPYLYNVSAAGTYTLTASTATCGPTSASIVISTNSPVVVDGCRSNTGTVTLSVSGGNGGSYDWYAASSGGSPLPGGTNTSTFTTPSISTTTTYWVEDNGLYNTTIGPPLTMGTGGSIGSTATIANNNVTFDLTQTLDLVGMTCQYWANNCSGSVTYSITITNAGTGFNQTRTGTAGACGPGAQTYTFTFATPITIPAGTGYVINGTGSSSTIVSYSGPFPYPSTYNSILTMKSTTNGSSDADAYPSLFDWQVRYDQGCARVPVVAEIGGSCALPVNLLNFSAVTNLSNVVLKWSTASETDNDYFLVQRSLDGEHYENVGIVKGNGTSNSVNNYSLTDHDSPFNIVYYRLVQVDKDGTGTYSNIISVNNMRGSSVSIYPNPFENGTTVALKSSYDYKVSLKISDLRGGLFYSADGIESNGTVTVGQNLPDGVYVLEVRSEEGIQTFRIVKLGK